MKINVGAFFLIVIGSFAALAQTKSFSDAQTEISTFDDFSAFTFYYDDAKYVTVVEINVEILNQKDDLRKTLPKFEWQLRSLFGIKGIDSKPVQSVLCINSQSKTFQFSRENELTIDFGDDQVSLGVPNRLSEVKKGKAVEKLCWEISKELIIDLAASKRTDFRLGTIKTQIRADKLEVIRDYGKLLEIVKN